ncbi:MAG: hypothetical protein OES57_08605 [Acidimicrobiia bacterium]|nr:hypothetical protein [Acidimicrobiia bacterium]
MRIAWAIVVLVVSVPCWLGQVISWWSPDLAVRWSLQEAEADVEPVFWADARAEAMWDSLTLWTLVVAGGLLLIDHGAWATWGLVGGAMYLYFAGRGIATRLEMRRRRFRIGAVTDVRTGLVACAVWGLVGATTLVAAAASIES